MTLLSAWREASKLAADYDEPFLIIETSTISRYRVVAERCCEATDRPVMRVNCDGLAALLPESRNRCAICA